MIGLWKVWADTARLTLEAQQVMALRAMRLSEGGPLAALEASRMVGEKFFALWESQAAAGLAALGGARMPLGKVAAPYRRAVRANRRRLSRKRRS